MGVQQWMRKDLNVVETRIFLNYISIPSPKMNVICLFICLVNVGLILPSIL